VPAGRLTSVEEVAATLVRDPRFERWGVRSRGADWIEVLRDGAILVLVWPSLWQDDERLEPHLVRSRSGNYGLMLLGTDDDFEHGTIDGRLHRAGAADVVLMAVPVAPARMVLALQARTDAIRVRQQAAGLELDLERAHHENDMLISIGRALSQQRDIGSLLEMILAKAREVTGADAGSVYVVEGDFDDVSRNTLRFKISQNDSVHIQSIGFAMPVSSSSIVGTCVLTRDVINIPDLYHLDAPSTGNNPWGFVHDRSFDEKYAYQTRSMLTVPMISARNHVIGVIQLINKRARGYLSLSNPMHFALGVVNFDDVSVAYAATLASQAGIALENAMLYDEVKTLFEGFVKASVTAIESRDPTTSGHSERVAALTVGLAKVTDRVDTGPYALVTFDLDDLKQIEYAGLLHDFGKVGVREHVLVKAKKLYEHQRDLILSRFHFIKKSVEVEQLRSKVQYLVEASREEAMARFQTVDQRSLETIRELDEFIQFVLSANEPSVLEQGGFERIADIAARRFLDGEGVEQPYLSEAEAKALQVLRGSLTAEERMEIESHVVHTYNFLRQIPWGRVYRDIPEIAGAHHEKLDGTGYPNRRRAEDIPVPAKMMTISDIYDALTASDRPYKKAMPAQRALDILSSDVKKGVLDAELFRLFVDARVYDLSKSSS
jgi:HD-GYP domain-containing protein (c-di-GMP phosphodiesterase class II)